MSEETLSPCFDNGYFLSKKIGDKTYFIERINNKYRCSFKHGFDTFGYEDFDSVKEAMDCIEDREEGKW